MNHRLDFHHRIPIEIFHDREDVSLIVRINNEIQFSKTYSAGITHKEEIKFYYDYSESKKNILDFEFNGNIESPNRYLKINSIEINDTYINLYNADYCPRLNKIWWNGLTEKKKKHYQTMIYGCNGNKFGWFGNIKYYFYCGVDFKSKWAASENVQETLLCAVTPWIFLDKSYTKAWDKKKSYGKLL